MTKKTILLLHASGFTGQMWTDIATWLEDYEVLIPDLPGHGSNKQLPFASIEQCADFYAERLREHLDASDKAIVVGLSLGAYIGFALAERHPELVERTMLCGLQITGIEQAGRYKLLANLLAPFLNFRYFRRKNYKAIGLNAASKLIDWDGPAPATSRTVVRVLTSSVEFSRSREALEAIKTPALVIAAQYDQPANVTSLPIMDQLMPVGQGYSIAGATLFWPLQRPELFAEILDCWIKNEDLPNEITPVERPAEA